MSLKELSFEIWREKAGRFSEESTGEVLRETLKRIIVGSSPKNPWKFFEGFLKDWEKNLHLIFDKSSQWNFWKKFRKIFVRLSISMPSVSFGRNSKITFKDSAENLPQRASAEHVRLIVQKTSTRISWRSFQNNFRRSSWKNLWWNLWKNFRRILRKNSWGNFLKILEQRLEEYFEKLVKKK